MSATSDLIDAGEQSHGPTCFIEELHRYRDVLKRYNLRYHLARYPKDVLAMWWRKDGCLPFVTSQFAFESYKAGKPPGRLYRGAPWKTQLRVIDGDKKGARILQR
jgi:hypothetical protein